MTSIQLERDAFHRLVLTLPDGERITGVVPVRAFPFAEPQGWVSLCDASGREVHCIRLLAELPANVLSIIQAELDEREFIPTVRRILDVSPGAEPTAWHVATDRGESRFTLTSEDHVRRLGGNGALISDGNGVRYRILDIRALDATSRRFLNGYL